MEEHIGKLIGQLREERGLSKKRLAREAGISDPYLVQIEKGARKPSEKIMRQLAKAMGLPSSVLLLPAGAYSEDVTKYAHRLAEDAYQDFAKLHNRIPEVSERQAILDAALLEAEHSSREAMSESGMSDEDRKRDEDESMMDGIARAVRNPQLVPDFSPSPEGWNDLSSKDQRFVQQLINRLRSESESD